MTCVLRIFLATSLRRLNACQRYVAGMDETEFLKDEKTQDAVIRTIEVIGEASNNILKRYPDIPRRYPSVPFGFAYEMRNAVAHGYFKVDLSIVWATVQKDLPGLLVAVREVLTRLSFEE